MVMPPWLLLLPCFPPCLSLLLQKHINQKSAPATQCTGGYPLTLLTPLRFKFLLMFQFPDPQLGCQKITLIRVIPSLKGKQSTEQVVVGGIFLSFFFFPNTDWMQCLLAITCKTGWQSPQTLASDICCLALACRSTLAVAALATFSAPLLLLHTVKERRRGWMDFRPFQL